MLAHLFRVSTQILSFSQVLLYLPLALDLGGKDTLLALSLFLSTLFSVQATTHLLTRNTPLRFLSTILSLLSPLLIPSLLLLTLNLYSSDSPSFLPSSTSSLFTLFEILKRAPGWWETFLTTMGPFFVILEGLSTLLCIQAFSRFSMDRIENSRTPDMARLVCLLGSACVYVASSYFLWESYDSVPDRLSATLLGVTVTSVLFLTGISFALNKGGSIVETSLIFAYVVFQIFHLSSRPEMYSASMLQKALRAKGKGEPPLPPIVLRSLDAVTGMITATFGAGVEFVNAASSALPLPVLVGLFYRITILYAASLVILSLKRKHDGKGSGHGERKRLSEEGGAERVTTFFVLYARVLLIAVYTHLLLLSSQSVWTQSIWKWLNIFLTVGLYGIELLIGSGSTAEGGWKED